MSDNRPFTVEFVYLESQGKYYPKRCSLCRHFRETDSGKVTRGMGLPLPDTDKSICARRSPKYGKPYIIQEHGVLPYRELHPNCDLFEWQKGMT